MPIAGVVIVIVEEKAEKILENLSNMENVTTYGIHKDNNIVAVFEGDSPRALENLTTKITKEVDGVMGIFPAYVNYEDDDK